MQALLLSCVVFCGRVRYYYRVKEKGTKEKKLYLSELVECSVIIRELRDIGNKWDLSNIFWNWGFTLDCDSWCLPNSYCSRSWIHSHPHHYRMDHFKLNSSINLGQSYIQDESLQFLTQFLHNFWQFSSLFHARLSSEHFLLRGPQKKFTAYKAAWKLKEI